MFHLLILILITGLAGSEDRFILENGFGEEAEWTEDYLDEVWECLVSLFDNPDVAPPLGIGVKLNRDAKMNGIGGYASPEEIGFVSNAWPMDRDRLWITAHEMVNLFAHHYGGGGGYPADWWSNGRSAFPEYVSCLVMEKLGHEEAAAYRRGVTRGEPDHELFWKLHERFGFELFSRFFIVVHEDGVVMGEIGAPWPHPDETRTAYTIAYLSLVADNNLAALFEKHDIGREPGNWRQIHPEIRFIPYRVSEEEVQGILAVRRALYSRTLEGEGFEILKELYRTGRIYLAEDDPVEVEAIEPVTDETEPGSSPVVFKIRSDFGVESLWVKEFLARTATSLVRVMGIKNVELPESVTVNLVMEAGLDGIGGGASKDSIDLVSDCWPAEPFRFWIVSQELAEWICFHIGGNLTGDGWSFERQAFATFAGYLALEESGHAEEAEWVKNLHQGNPDHAVFWRLHDRHGTAWIGRFFHLLRKDGVDFEQLPAGKRGLYLAAYLSKACDENLAGLFTDLGFGKMPHDWESRFPDTPFEECRITREKIEQLIDSR